SRYTNQRQDRNTHPMRWLALLVASVLLHLTAFNLAGGNLALPSVPQEKPAVVTTTLLVPQPPPVAAAPKPKAKPRRAPAPPPAALPPPSVDAAAVDTVAVDATAALPEQGIETPGTGTEPVPSADAATANAASRYKINPPPSAQLTYEVRALRDGRNWYGAGIFNWESGAGRYSITGEASVTLIFKITVLNFRSEGAIGDFGVAPELYSEKPWRKAMTNTHFQQANQTISFSASPTTYPYKGGEQDRASIIWQLAGIGRGDAQQFAPGAEIDIMVAGARDAETWRMQVIGPEEIDTAYGRMAAWHVVRAPRPGSYDQKIDIWLAPQQEWYPVKVLYTYANGDHLDLSLSGLTPAVAH
ncbi:MAG: DUF3108 domain-containing protein, partial [Noviherbaspirillum sp.]